MMMKHLLTAIACFFALSMSAQTPYNPDSDNDNSIGSEDLMGLLSLYATEFYPETNSSDSILIYDMQPEIDAHWELYPSGGGHPTITIPATADKVVMLSTNDDNCTQGPSYCSRVNLEVEDSYLYDEVTVIWVSTNHYPYNYWPDSYTYDNGGSHFKLINTGGGTWLGPWRQ
jgi:hypothetical protein